MIDALNRSKNAFASTPMLEIKKKEVAKATVRDIFGDEKPEAAELKQEVRAARVSVCPSRLPLCSRRLSRCAGAVLPRRPHC